MALSNSGGPDRRADAMTDLQTAATLGAGTTRSSLVRQRLQAAVVLLLIAALGIYGLSAIEAGGTVLGYSADAQRLAELREIQQVAAAGGDVAALPQTAEVAPAWIRAMAAITSDAYSYEPGSVWDTSIYYAVMPDWHRTLLSSHMILGGLAMLVGGFQFWPAFRRRAPRLHRRLGYFYVATVQVSMLFSMAYLLLTPVANIYSELIFYVGLWLLAITVTLSLWLSVYHVMRREIAQHQVWMALNFGLLLTAPLLRYDWILIGKLLPEISQYAGNLSVMVFLIPQSFLTGYLLLCLTRARQKDRAKVPSLPVADRMLALRPLWLPVAMLVLAAAAWLTVNHYWLAPGLVSSPLAQQLVPAGVVAIDTHVVVGQAGVRAAFVLAMLAALVAAALFLARAFVREATMATPAPVRKTAVMLALPALAAALIQMRWGYQYGLPGAATASGGTVYLLNGLVLAGFAAALLAATWRGRLSLVREWGVMTTVALLATPLFYANLQVLAIFGAEPRYIANGHIYMLAAAGGSLALLFAFAYVAYGEASREKYAG